jgi:hypothetical protein
MTPAGAIARGLAAGLIGTACMTALQEVMAKRRRARMPAPLGVTEDADPWSHAPAPAQLAKRVVEGLLQREISPAQIPLFTNAMHWGYGTALGAVYGIAESSFPGKPGVRGPLFGLGVWAQSYATLVPLGLYEWPWHYRKGAIAKDVSYHLLYGTGTALGFRLVSNGGLRRGEGAQG